MKLSTLFAAAFAIVGFCNTASAVTYPLPTDGSRLIGQNQVITIPEGNKQPLEYFAAEYQMGLSNMLEANPGVDTFLPKGGTVLNIPQQLILPDTVHEGIVINSAEMRLYYYPKGTNTVIVLPIGIGQLGKDTPINWVTKVERKKAGPTWTPTAKMHAEYAAAGEPLPAVVPAGPDNPMGLYALYIGRLYAIHGTNANFGIGLRVSHGCVRLRNDDIKFLFENVPVGTRVEFIDEPVKATTDTIAAAIKRLFLIIHQYIFIIYFQNSPHRTRCRFSPFRAHNPNRLSSRNRLRPRDSRRWPAYS